MSGIFERVMEILIGGLDSGTLADVSGLHLDFSVRSGEGIDTVATVSIFNLAESVLNKISTGGVIQVTAGHKSDNESREVFKGEITDVDPHSQGADTLYILTCTGATSNKFKVVSNVYDPSMSAFSIIEDLSKSIGMPIELDSETESASGLSNKQYAGGYTVYGSAMKTIRSICADVGLEVIVDDLSIRIFDSVKGDQSRILDINFESGLLKGLSLSKSSSNPGVPTYTCSSILFPEIRRGRRVHIDDGKMVGNFKVKTVEHKGSNYSNGFYSHMEVTE